ncbi:hypothetical protein SRB5_07140 [Streptomyces sp. RB5]|uniref:Uncharacterized protein n=1 Tax=Streptomyces smaragdinus TaxID=2585196 RepID=A0A7K0CB55_9ACTN|nr:hypothetical protein [Streptomyces smaragdinus]
MSTRKLQIVLAVLIALHALGWLVWLIREGL